MSEDVSVAGGLALLDMRKAAWDEDMQKALGDFMEFLPEICVRIMLWGTASREKARRNPGLLWEGCCWWLDAACEHWGWSDPSG